MNTADTINPGTSMMVNNLAEEELLLSHLKPDMRVLEFGLGISTQTIAKYVKEVVSIEYNHEFYRDFKEKLPANVTPCFVQTKTPQPGHDGTFEEFEDYVKLPMLFADPKFDVVYIDGRARVHCAEYAAKYYLKEGGLIFIHDYKHPTDHYRRYEYEIVEEFLTLEKHVFAMGMFRVKTVRAAMPEPQPKEIVLTDQQPTGFDQALQRILDEQIAELKGEDLRRPDQQPSPELVESAKDQWEAETKTESNPESLPEQTEPEKTEEASALIQDTASCWYSVGVVDEFNRFFDQHIKTHDITKHMEPFTKLRNCIVADSDHHLLDLGCGSAMLADWTREFEYYGADLPHILAGCALRNYPRHFYRACDILSDSLFWIDRFDVIVLNGVIDVMQEPLRVLHKVLSLTKKYLLIHRQEITEAGETRSIQKPSYGGYTWHSFINRKDFNDLVAGYGFRIVAEVPCSFGNWENGGSSFLLVKTK